MFFVTRPPSTRSFAVFVSPCHLVGHIPGREKYVVVDELVRCAVTDPSICFGHTHLMFLLGSGPKLSLINYNYYGEWGRYTDAAHFSGW